MKIWQAEPTADPIDIASQTAQIFTDTVIASFLQWQARQADHAGERRLQGLGDTCEDCGKPIPLARLEAQPNATRCIGCQKRIERRAWR